MQNPLRTRVLVAHSQPLVSAGLAATLGCWPEFDVQLRMPALFDSEADVTLLDCADGLRLAAERRHPPQGVRRGAIMIIAAQAGEWEIRQAIRLGVQGLHLVDAQLERLVAGVRALAAGARSFDESVSARMADCLTLPALTKRERDVLSLLAEGACNKDVARRLNIALGTVKAHVRTLLDKLDVDSRTQAIVVANERGIVSRQRMMRERSLEMAHHC